MSYTWQLLPVHAVTDYNDYDVMPDLTFIKI